jgi:hypothetical protein
MVPLQLRTTKMHEKPSPNERIDIFGGALEVIQKEKFVEKGDGKVFLSLHPEPAIGFELHTTALHPPIFYGEVLLKLVDLNVSVLAFVTDMASEQTDNSTRIEGRVWKQIILKTGRPLKVLQFSLINFHARSSFILEAEGWKASISPLPQLNDTVERLKLASGFALTHVANVERSDGSMFTAEQADDILGALFYLLSFARGFWVSPILTTGLDDAGAQAWTFWYPYKSHPWQNVGSWFREITPQLLARVFPGFVQTWHNPMWREPLTLVLDWYMESNTQHTETSLFINQAAFELLSWVLLVEDKAILSREGFDKLFASDKLRLLLSQSSISLAIDARQVNLTKLARESNWQDGPHALTEMRNRMVHPKLSDLSGSHKPKAIRNILGYPVPARAEACELGLWYLEKVLLSLFGYTQRISSGRLMNRFIEPE